MAPPSSISTWAGSAVSVNRGWAPRKEYRATFSAPSTLSNKNARGRSRSRRNAEIGVSRSASTSHDTGTRFPSRARRSNSCVPGSSASALAIVPPRCTLAAAGTLLRLAEPPSGGPGRLEQCLETVSVPDRRLQPGKLLAKYLQRLSDLLAVEPANLRPQ